MTNLSFRAFDLYAAFFQRFETIVFMWNSQKKQLIYVQSKRKLMVWIINTFLTTILSNGFCVYLLVRELLSPVKHLQTDFIVFQTFLVIFGFFWLVTGISSWFYGHDCVQAWNYVISFGEKLKLDSNGKLDFNR